MSDPATDITRLRLVGRALQAAHELAKAHPSVAFTSGRRSRIEQARAMAANVARIGPDWIACTYKPSDASLACQQWVSSNREAKSASAITAGLLKVFGTLSDEQVSKLSKHLTGEAFDVQPVSGVAGELILQSMRAVAKKHQGLLLEREGGLIRWHMQF